MIYRAEWNGQVLAESAEVVMLEGNAYFPESSVRRDFLKPSETHTICPWKGTASYWTIEVAGQQNPDAAWFYPSPKTAAAKIEGRVAFWRGVVVRQVG